MARRSETPPRDSGADSSGGRGGNGSASDGGGGSGAQPICATGPAPAWLLAFPDISVNSVSKETIEERKDRNANSAVKLLLFPDQAGAEYKTKLREVDQLSRKDAHEYRLGELVTLFKGRHWNGAFIKWALAREQELGSFGGKAEISFEDSTLPDGSEDLIIRIKFPSNQKEVCPQLLEALKSEGVRFRMGGDLGGTPFNLSKQAVQKLSAHLPVHVHGTSGVVVCDDPFGPRYVVKMDRSGDFGTLPHWCFEGCGDAFNREEQVTMAVEKLWSLGEDYVKNLRRDELLSEAEKLRKFRGDLLSAVEGHPKRGDDEQMKLVLRLGDAGFLQFSKFLNALVCLLGAEVLLLAEGRDADDASAPGDPEKGMSGVCELAFLELGWEAIALPIISNGGPTMAAVIHYGAETPESEEAARALGEFAKLQKAVLSDIDSLPLAKKKEEAAPSSRPSGGGSKVQGSPKGRVSRGSEPGASPLPAKKSRLSGGGGTTSPKVAAPSIEGSSPGDPLWHMRGGAPQLPLSSESWLECSKCNFSDAADRHPGQLCPKCDIKMEKLISPPNLQSLHERHIAEKEKEAVASSQDTGLEDIFARAGVQGTGARSGQ